MKCKCSECGWKGRDTELLTAVNPFDEYDDVCGCPDCHAVESDIQVCDVADCWNEATCGFPTDHGYMRTCGKHFKP